MFTEKGKVVFIGAVQSGVSSRSGEEWQMQDIVIETSERWPRKIVATIGRADQIAAHNLRLGEIVEMMVEISAHEYNGNWYPDCRCIDILSNGISRFVQAAAPPHP